MVHFQKISDKSNKEAMKRNWSNQKQFSAIKSEKGNDYHYK